MSDVYFPVPTVLVGDGANTGTNRNNLVAGDLLVVDRTFTPLTTTTAAAVSPTDPIFILQGTGDAKLFRQSMPIVGRKIKSVVGVIGAAGTVANAALGYTNTTTSGTIEVANSTEYQVALRMRFDHRMQYNKPYDMVSAIVTSAAATQWEIASGLWANMISSKFNTQNGLETRLYSAATVTAATPTATVTNNSVLVTLSVADSNIVAGSYLRLTAVAVANSLYKVRSVNGTSVTLTSPYLGATASGTAYGVIALATLNAAAAGIKITATNVAVNLAGQFLPDYQQIDFDLFLLNGFTSATSYVKTAAVAAKGDPLQVQLMDRKSQIYNEQKTNTTLFPTDTIDVFVDKTKVYNLASIVHFENVDAMINPMAYTRVTTVAIPQPNNNAQHGADFLDILNAYLVAQGFTALAY